MTRWSCAAVLLLAWSGISLAAEPDKRPNILFALADDWAWPHAGVYGDKVVRTPTFDRVAKEGVLFSHAFCVAPSCTPSRAAHECGRQAGVRGGAQEVAGGAGCLDAGHC